MPRVFATGRDLGLTIGGNVFTGISTEVTLEETITRVDIQPITSNSDIKLKVNQEATLSVTAYQDWNSSGAGITAIAKALYDAAASAPDTALAFSFTVGGTTFTGDVYPEKPNVGGAATDALTFSVSLPVKGGVVTRS